MKQTGPVGIFLLGRAAPLAYSSGFPGSTAPGGRGGNDPVAQFQTPEAHLGQLFPGSSQDLAISTVQQPGDGGGFGKGQ